VASQESLLVSSSSSTEHRLKAERCDCVGYTMKDYDVVERREGENIVRDDGERQRSFWRECPLVSSWNEDIYSVRGESKSPSQEGALKIKFRWRKRRGRTWWWWWRREGKRSLSSLGNEASSSWVKDYELDGSEFSPIAFLKTRFQLMTTHSRAGHRFQVKWMVKPTFYTFLIFFDIRVQSSEEKRDDGSIIFFFIL
jgi:hypothetical protein